MKKKSRITLLKKTNTTGEEYQHHSLTKQKKNVIDPFIIVTTYVKIKIRKRKYITLTINSLM